MRLQQSEEVSLFTMKHYSKSIDTISCVCAEALCLSTNANAHNLSSHRYWNRNCNRNCNRDRNSNWNRYTYSYRNGYTNSTAA